MELLDWWRLFTCLGLLTVTVLIGASMRGRLYDSKSRWLLLFVVGSSLSMFMGTATRIGTEEPIVWYGTPLRSLLVVFAFVYIWITHERNYRDA